MQLGMASQGPGGLGGSTLWTPPGAPAACAGWGVNGMAQGAQENWGTQDSVQQTSGAQDASAYSGGGFSFGNPYVASADWGQYSVGNPYANNPDPWAPANWFAKGGAQGSSSAATPSIPRPRPVKSKVLPPEEAATYRKEHQITVVPPDSTVTVPGVVVRFEDADLPKKVCEAMRAAGFSAPTEIQAQVLPVLRAGHDMIGISKAGSGKTLAFLAPGFAHVQDYPPADAKAGPVLLVLAPTRELVTQIQIEALTFGRSSGILSCAVYGGASRASQLEWVRQGCHLVVATPGRLNDLLESGQLVLDQVTYLVLDEADRMLDMGFEPQIRKAIGRVPESRQTALFSATWPKEVRKLAHEFLSKPIQVHIGEVEETRASVSISQEVIVLETTQEKDEALEKVLAQEMTDPQDKCIIFVSTKQMCRNLAWRLQRSAPAAEPESASEPSAGQAQLDDHEPEDAPEGASAPSRTSPKAHGSESSTVERGVHRKSRGCAEIHGDKDQRERNQALESFKNGKTPILIATDVAGRGLHIEKVKLVVNFDVAGNAEEHVHRIGRTGRAGARGKSVTFLCRSVPTDVAKAKWLCSIMERAAVEAGVEPQVPEALRELRNAKGADADSWGGKGGKGRSKGKSGGGGMQQRGRPMRG